MKEEEEEGTTGREKSKEGWEEGRAHDKVQYHTEDGSLKKTGQIGFNR